jgi:ABC-type polysaccharide/polyol phosphate export permease
MTEGSSILTESQEVVFKKRDPRKLALDDFTQSLKNWRIWLMLAYQDIKLRYRRSMLGPFWITLSMAITAYMMGYLYSSIFKIQMGTYFPYIVAGMLCWALVSSTITDLMDTLPIYETMIKQLKLPYTLYVQRVVVRNFIIFFHNILVLIPVLAIFHNDTKVNLNTLLLIPALALIYINGLSYGLVLAMIGARYRDVSQIVKSLIQVVFFVTPIMWLPTALPSDKQFIIYINPFYSYVEVLRAPMLGKTPAPYEVGMVIAFTLLGIVLCYRMFTRYRARIVHWV